MADGSQDAGMTTPKTLGEAKQRGSDIAVVAHGRGHLPAFVNMGQVMEYAAAMAGAGTMIRAPLRGNVGACLGIIETASRFGIAPFALAAKAYLVNDQIAYEAQAVNAMIYATGYIEGRLKYRFEGSGDDLKVYVTGRIKGEPEELEYESPRKADIKPQNSPLWKNDPQMQIGYYGSRAWCRRHAPDLLMGIYAVDEFERGVVDVTPERSQSPADRLTASINKSAEDRAQESAPEPEEQVQDADFTDADAEESTANDTPPEPDEQAPAPDRQEEKFACESEGNAQGDLLVSEPETDGNGAKLKKAAPTGQTSAAAAVEKATAEAASETPEKPGEMIRTSEGALAWAQQWAAYYCSIPKDEEDGFIDETAASIRICKSINSQAEDIFSNAVNYGPDVAADKEARANG